MDILLLSEVSANRVIGGAERMLREQALGLAGLGHRVGIVSRAAPDDPAAHVSVDGVPEYRYAVSRGHEAAFFLSSVRESLRTFEAARAGRQLDAALVYQSLAGFGPIRHRAGRAGAWVYMCLSLAHEEYLSRVPPGRTSGARVRRALNARVRLWVERWVMRRCHHVTVMSRFMQERVQRFHGIHDGRLSVLPGAADTGRFFPAEDRRSVRDALGLPPDRTVLFTVRNLVPRMGLEHLVEAVSLLKERRDDVLVLIGGQGPLREPLQARIEASNLGRHVRLLGFVGEEALPKYFQAADCVVMPTVELEGFGLVTVEALACGTPVLGTPVGATPEILGRIDPLLVTEDSDAAALARSLRLLLDRFRAQPGERARLAARGLELVRSEYNWGSHSGRLESLIREAGAGAMGGRAAGSR